MEIYTETTFFDEKSLIFYVSVVRSTVHAHPVQRTSPWSLRVAEEVNQRRRDWPNFVVSEGNHRSQFLTRKFSPVCTVSLKFLWLYNGLVHLFCDSVNRPLLWSCGTGPRLVTKDITGLLHACSFFSYCFSVQEPTSAYTCVYVTRTRAFGWKLSGKFNVQFILCSTRFVLFGMSRMVCGAISAC